MRKFLTVILSVALCLSLCACGSRAANQATEAASPAPQLPESAYHPMCEQLYGRWEVSMDALPSDPAPYTVLVLNEDGTCEMDGVKGEWRVNVDNSDWKDYGCVSFDLYVDMQAVAGGMLFENGYLSPVEASGWITPWSLRNVAQNPPLQIPAYEQVEITLDNWQEYFEIVETEPEWHEDAFGDVEYVERRAYFCLKEAYMDRVNVEGINLVDGSVTVEWDFLGLDRCVSVDWENRTFTVGEISEFEDDPDYRSSEIFSFGYFREEENGRAFHYIPIGGASVDMYGRTVDSQGRNVAFLLEDFRVTRIEGHISLRATE